MFSCVCCFRSLSCFALRSVTSPVTCRFLSAFAGSDAEYNKLVDEELNRIEGALDEVADDVDNLDYNIASGVLSINMGSKGSYVINKQSPNKQIWWSSPISGPKRFEYDVNTTKWYEVGEMDGVKNTRKVNEDINALLTKELKTLLGVDLKF